jgi:hypothetical protein
MQYRMVTPVAQSIGLDAADLKTQSLLRSSRNGYSGREAPHSVCLTDEGRLFDGYEWLQRMMCHDDRPDMLDNGGFALSPAAPRASRTVSSPWLLPPANAASALLSTSVPVG